MAASSLARREHPMCRFLGITIGILIHAVFGVMVCDLYWFLKGGVIAGSEGALWIDFLLALQFVVVHSLLLYPAVRERLSEWITPAFYGLFFCVSTIAGLWLAMVFWLSSQVVWWEFAGPTRLAIDAGWFGSWALLF